MNAYNSILTVATAGLTIVGIAAWWKRRDVGIPLGLFLIYYWTLYGAWTLIGDAGNPTTASRYFYLYDRLFPVLLDEYYLRALTLYSTFCVIVAVVLYLLLPRRAPTYATHAPVRISHWVVIATGGAAGIISYLIVRDTLATALALNQSGYIATRTGEGIGELFTLHQVMNRLALLPTSIGFAVWCSGENARMVTGRSTPLQLAGYLAVLIGMYFFCVALGNKNELLAALLGGVLFYLSNDSRPRVVPVAAFSTGVLAFIALIDSLRGAPLADVSSQFGVEEAWTSFARLSTSNEAFGPHFSLYGVLRFDVPITWGSSVLSLVLSVVPRYFWPDRPADIYPYYAEHVGAAEGQGYGLHHVAGWYLNFGTVGVVAGAVAMGGIWAWLLKEFDRKRGRGTMTRLLVSIGPAMFVAGLPNLIRAGIEGYKGLVVDSFLVPTVTLLVAHVVSKSASAATTPRATLVDGSPFKGKLTLP